MTTAEAPHKGNSFQAFRQNARLLKRRASKHAWIGMAIGVGAVLMATALLAYLDQGTLYPPALLKAQQDNPSLWFLDAMPFVFAFWGQYVSALMAFEAGAMVMDHTSQLQAKNEALEREVRSSVTNDVLTGLPNWLLLLDRLDQAIRNARYEDTPLAVVRVGFEGFKETNDMVGYYNGDRILKEIAHRLERTIDDPDTLARPGGADFVILLTKLQSPAEANEAVARIRDTLEAPFTVDGVQVPVHPHIGTVYYPHHGDNEDSLLQSAYQAMMEARKKGEPVGVSLRDPAVGQAAQTG
ncbi:MAG: diguanylate cyclase domain-containing protein [Thiohalorhabdus sp.]|uniref:diguanylate cyclase domain-containing protein n=1 Tax=Thiohalorhabdus sp. TaxID=3094134 RepID=UPI00397EC306